MQEKLTFIEVSKVTTQIIPNMEKLLIETIRGYLSRAGKLACVLMHLKA